jgi:hypothetical protein
VVCSCFIPCTRGEVRRFHSHLTIYFSSQCASYLIFLIVVVYNCNEKSAWFGRVYFSKSYSSVTDPQWNYCDPQWVHSLSFIFKRQSLHDEIHYTLTHIKSFCQMNSTKSFKNVATFAKIHSLSRTKKVKE